MATAVLRSSDPLLPLHRLESFGSRPPPPPAKPLRRSKPSRSASSSPPSSSRTHPPPPRRRVSFAADKENRTSAAAAAAMVIKFPSPNLVMERVHILKRGESPAPGGFGGGDEISPVFSTNRLGPEPEILPKQIGFSDPRPVYAGPGYINSPAPSALPFPASFIRGVEEAPAAPAAEPPCLDEAATKGLRCLLRLGNLP